jgi:hypothetical protein
MMIGLTMLAVLTLIAVREVRKTSDSTKIDSQI